MKTSRKAVVWIIFLILISFGIWWFFGRETKPVYETETVRGGSIREVINVSGTLEPDNATDVSFELSGTLRLLSVKEGETVTQGEILAKIDDSVLQAQRREAILAVQTAVQQEWLARRSWDSLKKEEREIKKLASESARAQLATLEKNIAKTVLAAPVSGVITKVYPEQGEVITAASPIVRIMTGTGMHLESDVPESDVAKIISGQLAEVTFDALTIKDIFPAKVESIDTQSTVIQDIVYYQTTFSLQALDDRFRPGMSVDIDIETKKNENALLLSRRAIREDKEGSFVEIYSEGVVSRKLIVTGIEDDEGNVEILSGVSRGDSVIVGEVDAKNN